MAMLHYLCPTERHEAASDIGLDQGTFETTKLKVVRVDCLLCGSPHRFLMADGWLDDDETRLLQ